MRSPRRKLATRYARFESLCRPILLASVFGGCWVRRCSSRVGPCSPCRASRTSVSPRRSNSPRCSRRQRSLHRVNARLPPRCSLRPCVMCCRRIRAALARLPNMWPPKQRSFGPMARSPRCPQRNDKHLPKMRRHAPKISLALSRRWVSTCNSVRRFDSTTNTQFFTLPPPH